MVTFDMFPHTDSLKRERGRENVDLIWKPGESSIREHDRGDKDKKVISSISCSITFLNSGAVVTLLCWLKEDKMIKTLVPCWLKTLQTFKMF